jgi:hypothetical protein
MANAVFPYRIDRAPRVQRARLSVSAGSDTDLGRSDAERPRSLSRPTAWLGRRSTCRAEALSDRRPPSRQRRTSVYVWRSDKPSAAAAARIRWRGRRSRSASGRMTSARRRASHHAASEMSDRSAMSAPNLQRTAVDFDQMRVSAADFDQNCRGL